MLARLPAQLALRSLLLGCTAFCVALGLWRFELFGEMPPLLRILCSLIIAALFVGGLVGFTSGGEHGFLLMVVSWPSMAIFLFVVACTVWSGVT